MVVLSGLKRSDIIATLEYFVGHGKPAGRRIAVQSLADFNGADVNAMVIRACATKIPTRKHRPSGNCVAAVFPAL